LAPFLIIIGYVVIFYAIMKKTPSDDSNQGDTPKTN
jgi:hypothetical protein